MKVTIRLTTALLLTAYSGFLYSQNIEGYKEKELDFVSSGNKISGKLIAPLEASDKKLPIVVFVYGSGPGTYSSSDNYGHGKFTEKSFACYSWDRPSVENSEGKWYELGVKERGLEVVEAVKVLKILAVTNPTKIGFWGISQASWVWFLFTVPVLRIITLLIIAGIYGRNLSK